MHLSSCIVWANLTLILGLAFWGTLRGMGLETTRAGRFAGGSSPSAGSGRERGSPTILTFGGPEAAADGGDTGLISFSTKGASTTSAALKGARDPKRSVGGEKC